MRILYILGVGFGATLLAGQALAGTEAGRSELSVSGSYSYEWVPSEGSGNGVNNFLGTVGFGHFFTDALELKFQGVFDAMTGHGTTIETLEFMIGPDYHFMTKGSFVPYIGVYGGILELEAGAFGGSTATTGGMVDGHIGLKQFVSERASIDYRLSYQYWNISGSELDSIIASVGLDYEF